MRRKLAMLLATALAGGMIALGPASPASAQEPCTANDPVLAYVCSTLGDADPIGWVNYYYYEATGLVHWAYCQVSPYC